MTLPKRMEGFQEPSAAGPQVDARHGLPFGP
jgi:hypothetical protein